MTNRPSRLAYVLVRLVSVEVAAAGSGAVVIVVLVIVVVVVVVVACVGLERFGGLGPCGFRMTSYRFLQLLCGDKHGRILLDYGLGGFCTINVLGCPTE